LPLLAVVAIVFWLTGRWLAPLVLSAQTAPVFSAESSLVVLHVTVKDKHGKYVSGLSRDAFQVFEDGRPQDVSLFTAEDAPVSIGLLVDNSGSMYGNRDLVVAAAAAFVERSNPSDEIFGLTFNETVKPVLPPELPFTNDVRVLRSALAESIIARGRTALYDAVDDGIAYLSMGRFERKALVVVSDGGDNASETTYEQLLGRVRASNVVIHAVGLVDPVEPEANPKRLRQLAEASGGTAFRPGDARQVRDALERVALDIRNAYTLGYTPADSKAAGFHQIRAVVRAPNVKDTTVRTRAGYMAGPAHGAVHHGE
jgi:VWFA-related protein